jgi:glucose/mannose-6-phosphate isomerase
MLDDLKLIHERDITDALSVAEKQPKQLMARHGLVGPIDKISVKNVVYIGMGGSALAANFVRVWPGLMVPFEVVRDYDLPGCVGPGTLAIYSSYSGNTEETLSTIDLAAERGATIAVITGGGILGEIAAERDYLRGIVPQVAQPRFSVFHNIVITLEILAAFGLVDESVFSDLLLTAEKLEGAVKAWLSTVPTAINPAKQLALEALGKSVVIYAGQKLAPAAYKWKISFNENAKQIAWVGQYPEFNHNEFIGWTKQPVDKPYLVIELRSNLEHERIQKRFDVSERLLSGVRPSPEHVYAQGQTILEQLLWASLLGDFVTIYAAIASGVNPMPVELVEKLKHEMAA